jgi:hypothetical protein
MFNKSNFFFRKACREVMGMDGKRDQWQKEAIQPN